MQIAVITGAANGIGLALSQIHLEQGHMVVMVDKNQNKLNHEHAQLNATFPGQIAAHACDVTQAEEVEHLAQQVAQLGSITWIYNNAGIIGQLAPVWELKTATVQQVFEVNLYGMMHVIQAFTPQLLAQDTPSHIINIASLYALCAGSQTAAYSMSKHAVLALSESLHFDLSRLNKPVDVSVVFPSFTDTGLLAQSPEEKAGFHNTLQSLLSHSRPPLEVAQQIVTEVMQKKFYIFPDREVKGYCDERTKALINQESPHQTEIEKLMGALIRRRKI